MSSVWPVFFPPSCHWILAISNIEILQILDVQIFPLIYFKIYTSAVVHGKQEPDLGVGRCYQSWVMKN